jgi:hypothetical protein
MDWSEVAFLNVTGSVMANSTPVSDKKKADPTPLIPPEEQFWKRYSPHGEAPLSVAGSFAVHALVAGGMILIAFYVASLFARSTGSLPIEPVRLDTGGGGGKPTGVGDGPGVGSGPQIGENAEENVSGDQESTRRPTLDAAEAKKIQQNFAPEDFRAISQSETGKALARLDEGLASKLRDGLNPGRGKGGRGSGGGKGTGTGTGTGPGTGSGTATLTQREKRMLRWNMRFTANTGSEYLAQLHGLGAILAFPVNEGPKASYKIVRDLRAGGKLLDEDVSKIDRIYWFDTKPRSVIDILNALGIRMRRIPNQFVAFMPKELENQLFEMERGYVERVLKKTFEEDRIEETQFRVVPTGRGGYRPELISVTMK